MSAPPFSIAILGNDAFLAASPALPVQLMHAALAAGFDAVVPVSLGDELVAGETLRLAQLRGRRPVVQCSCPFSLTQLCKREANLADVTIAVAPAAVALARALRLERDETQHITYIGACPGAQDPAIDLQVIPDAFLRGLAKRGIVLLQQPEVFSDRVPPDRRRFLSLPGGAPRTDLITALLRRNTVALSARTNPLLAVADALFDGGVTMIDPAGAYRCVCAGADAAPSVAEGRVAITNLEPARALSPIFEAPAWLDLRPSELPVAGEPADNPFAPPPLASFADAAQLTSPSGQVAPPQQAPAAPVPSDAARRLYALGVRSARRRAPQGPASGAEIAQAAMDEHLPPTSPSLHARPMEREMPLSDPRDPIADRLGDLDAPPLRRPPSLDDLLRRD
ncbi:MAG: hypothetical protein V4813_13460 [Gemmatimonadota bacterium]